MVMRVCVKMSDTLISVTFDEKMLMKLGKLGMLRQRQFYILAHKWVMIGDGFLQLVPRRIFIHLVKHKSQRLSLYET